jgi:hypothetical protein
MSFKKQFLKKNKNENLFGNQTFENCFGEEKKRKFVW